MLIAEWEGASIVVDQEQASSPDPATQRVLDGLLSRPADKAAGFELEDGTMEDGAVTLKPGQPGHARAAVRQLRGLVIVVDDGDDIEAVDL
jgi:hypothetical protein